MRPNNNQQNNNKNRQRGRNNNGGRKHVNPLSRNYESNGPDVKVRGNAAHVAEKYVQLARDAQSSGDSVMAENYLQHAEHYFRIVSAAQPQQPRADGTFAQQDEDFDDDFLPINDRFSMPERPSYEQQQLPQRNDQQGGGQQNGGQHNGGQQSSNGQQPQPQQQAPQQRGFDAEGDSQAPVEASAGGETGEMPAQGEGEPRRHRDRRPRRRSRGNGGGEGVDPANAPQPEVGDLPAFITAGGGPAAE